MNKYRVDGEKLKKAMAKRGLALTRASQELGFGISFLSNVVGRGTISASAMKLLGTEYNIKLEEIEADPEPPAVEVQPEQMQMEAPDGLTYQEIAQAVAEGIRAALEVMFEEYAIYKVGGVQTIRKRAEKEPDHV